MIRGIDRSVAVLRTVVELLQRVNYPQLVGAQWACPPELWRRSRLDGAAGSFISLVARLFGYELLNELTTQQFNRVNYEDTRIPGQRDLF